MGRAIDMENKIDSLVIKVEKLENITRGMATDLSSLMGKSSSVKNIDIHKETKGKNDKKKTNNKASSNSNNTDNGKNATSKSKTNENGDGSK